MSRPDADQSTRSELFEEDRDVAQMSHSNSWAEGIWGSSDRTWNREADRETEIRALHTKLLEKNKELLQSNAVIALLYSGYSKQSDFLTQMGFKLSAGEIVVDRSLPWMTDERARIAEKMRRFVRSQIMAETESSEGFTTGSRNLPPREPREEPVLWSSERR